MKNKKNVMKVLIFIFAFISSSSLISLVTADERIYRIEIEGPERVVSDVEVSLTAKVFDEAGNTVIDQIVIWEVEAIDNEGNPILDIEITQNGILTIADAIPANTKIIIRATVDAIYSTFIMIVEEPIVSARNNALTTTEVIDNILAFIRSISLDIIVGVVVIIIIIALVIIAICRNYSKSKKNIVNSVIPNESEKKSVDFQDVPQTHRQLNSQPIPIIQVINLTKSIKEKGYKNPRNLLEDVNFEIYKGDMICIIGKSGSGKSTLLKILAGYDKKVTGNLNFLEEGYTWKKNNRELKRYIGYVPQIDSLYTEVTPKQLLEHYQKVLPSNYCDHQGSVDILLIERLGLDEEAINTKIEKLSGGQRKRVSIAIEFLRRPNILILDEPDSGLDPESRKDLYERIAKFDSYGKIGERKKTTIIFSTHYQDIVKTKSKIYHSSTNIYKTEKRIAEFGDGYGANQIEMYSISSNILLNWNKEEN